MSDRPMPTNGKRFRAWGTREQCPACGACLCFACHPQGPCVEDRHAGSGFGAPGSSQGQGFGTYASYGGPAAAFGGRG